MTTSNPMRLDRELVQAASAVAERQKRSVPRQIEYWAELGRSVESVLDPETLIAVQEGLARLVVEMAPSAPVSSADVFRDLDNSRARGTLSTRVSSAPVRYQASTSAPGLLEQIHSDGAKILGRFSSGQFVPIEK